MEQKKWNRDCRKCRAASARTDDKGYPFGIEFLKYNDSLDVQMATKEKTFMI